MRKLFLIIFLQIFCLAYGLPINIDFFKKFNDEYFEKYICEALESNHDLKQANYRVEQYRYEISSQFSNELPSLSVSSNYLGASVPVGDTNVLIKRNSYILPFMDNFHTHALVRVFDHFQTALYNTA